MGRCADENKYMPYLIEYHGIITRVNTSFCDLTDYSLDELLGKPIEEVTKELLRISIDLSQLNDKADAFLFTKYLEAKRVHILKLKNDENNETIYTFNEIINSRLEEKIPYVKHLYNIEKLNRKLIEEQNKKLKHQVTKLAEQNKQLMSQAEQLETVFDTMSDALIVFDAAFNILSMNRVAKELLYNSDRVKTAEDVYRIVHLMDMDDNPIPVDKMPLKRAMNGEKVTGFRMKVDQPDREIIVDTNAIPHFDSQGNVSMVIICYRDITDSLKKQKELLRQNGQLEAIIESISDGLAVIDNNGKFIKTNKTLTGIMANQTDIGTTVESAGETIKKGQKYFDEFGKELRIEDLSSFKVLRGEKVVNQHVIVKSGTSETHMYFSAIPVFDINGDFDFGVITSHDITDLIQKDKKIKQQKELLEAVIENMNDAIAIFDNEGNGIFRNAEARRMYPNLRNETKNENIHDGYICLDLDNNLIPVQNLPTRRVFKGEKIRNERVIIKYPDRRSRVVEINAVPVLDDENNLLSVVVTHHDVSETIEYQETLKNQKEFLQNIINNAYENLSVVDNNGRYLIMRNNIIKEVSKTFDNVKELYESAKHFYLDGNELPQEELTDSLVLRGEVVRDNIINIKADKKDYYLINNGTPIYDDKGNFLYGVVSSSNITELIRIQQSVEEMQEQLLKAEREKMKALKKQ